MLKQRILIGAALVALLSLILWLDHGFSSDLGFVIIISIACVLGLSEFYRLATNPQRQPHTALAIFIALLLFAHEWAGHHRLLNTMTDFVPAALFILTFASLGMAVRPSAARSLDSVAITLLGLVYLWLPLHYALALRHLPLGEELVVFLVATSKGGDIFAYFFGRALGRHPLAPTLSPKKTIEGACAGLAGSAIIGIVVWELLGMSSLMVEFEVDISALATGGIGLLLGFVSQIGDLLESFVKRQCSAKESSSLLPGFGGVLDVIDSFTTSAPVAFFIFNWLLTQ